MRNLLFIFCLIGSLTIHAQALNMPESELYHSRIKLVSEFMDRFNGNEFHPLVDSTNAEKIKLNYGQLFDIENILSNKEKLQPETMELIDSISKNHTQLAFSDTDWFAKAKCLGSLNGKEVLFDIYLTVEKRKNDMYKWVISEVSGDIFSLNAEKGPENAFLLPNEHESNFMNLHYITSGNEKNITSFMAKSHQIDAISVFSTLVYYGLLDITHVSDLEFIFLQVPGFAFSVKEQIRDSSNAGWLISSWQKMDTTEKENLLQALHHNQYSPTANLPDSVSTTLIESTAELQANACETVTTFINNINKFLKEQKNDLKDKIKQSVSGKYSFRISDNLSKALCDFFQSEKRVSYNFDTFITWLSDAKCPITGIYISDILPFENENLKEQYAKGFQLVSATLKAEGKLQLEEQIVFFVYGEQIAGVKLISDCF